MIFFVIFFFLGDLDFLGIFVVVLIVSFFVRLMCFVRLFLVFFFVCFFSLLMVSCCFFVKFSLLIFKLFELFCLCWIIGFGVGFLLDLIIGLGLYLGMFRLIFYGLGFVSLGFGEFLGFGVSVYMGGVDGDELLLFCVIFVVMGFGGVCGDGDELVCVIFVMLVGLGFGVMGGVYGGLMCIVGGGGVVDLILNFLFLGIDFLLNEVLFLGR